MSNYNFGEKTKEYNAKQGKEVEVWQSPKYKSSKEKAIELIDKGDFGLKPDDFWILMNATRSGKMAYTGLILSHNGCLKINSNLDAKMQFKPSSVSFYRDDSMKVLQYVNDDQGIYEFGEVSDSNCKNAYPYAMLLKRLMDRVILKTSKVAFYGIYSESESDEFKEVPDEKSEEKPKPIVKEPKDPVKKQGSAFTREDFAKLQKEGTFSDVYNALTTKTMTPKGKEQVEMLLIEKIKTKQNHEVANGIFKGKYTKEMQEVFNKIEK